MVRDDGSIDAADLYDAGAAGGFTVHQIRLCVARLVKEGAIDQQGRGRRAELRLTASGRRKLEPLPQFVRLAFEQDAGRAPWDGLWHVVTFSIPEERRSARNDFRESLLELGAAVADGAYVCANDWDDAVIERADELGVTEQVTLFTATRLRVEGESEPRRIAKALWDLDALAERWRQFVRDQRPTVERLGRGVNGIDDDEVRSLLAPAIRLVAAFDTVMHADPLLPPELLPASWPGVAGRRILLRASNAISVLRDRHQLPALFSQYDAVMDEAQRDLARA
jgi:phenylacetic acid degradation operon negative regulatory protein